MLQLQVKVHLKHDLSCVSMCVYYTWSQNFEVWQLPFFNPMYMNLYLQVEDQDGTKVVTNTTIEKQSNDKGEGAIIKEVKTAKGKDGQGMQVILQSSFSNHKVTKMAYKTC